MENESESNRTAGLSRKAPWSAKNHGALCKGRRKRQSLCSTRQPTLRAAKSAGTRYVRSFANEFLLRFLETLDLLGMSIARMPPEAPCICRGECFCQDAEQHGVFGKDKEDEMVNHDGNDVE